MLVGGWYLSWSSILTAGCVCENPWAELNECLSSWACDNKKARNKHPKMCFSPRFVVPYRDGGLECELV